MGNTRKLALKTKLLIFEFKERYPALSPEELIEIFSLDPKRVHQLLNEEYIIVPSKMNRNE